MNVRQIEPDREEFDHLGFKCAVIRMSRHGHFCGYVGLDETHPWYGLGEPQMRRLKLAVHGGITFAQKGMRTMEHQADLWWVGFDCNHPELGDIAPRRGNELDQLLNQVCGIVDMLEGHGQVSTSKGYRNFEFAKAETKKLALLADKAMKRKVSDA